MAYHPRATIMEGVEARIARRLWRFRNGLHARAPVPTSTFAADIAPQSPGGENGAGKPVAPAAASLRSPERAAQ